MFPRQTIPHHSNSSLCPVTNAEETDQYYEELEDLLELTLKKKEKKRKKEKEKKKKRTNIKKKLSYSS